MSRKNPLMDAVVVTYNRLDKLKNCIAAINAQSVAVRFIHVVDNNSSDGTKEWLLENAERLNIIPHILDYNGGGAGGFNVGIKAAYNAGADWTWVMDDDVYPKLDCLKALVESSFFHSHTQGTREIGFLASRVEWVDGSICLMNIPVLNWPPNASFHEAKSSLPLTSSSFVSCFISRVGVERVGLPVKEFFIWCDDTEYTRRLSKNFDCYYLDDSVVIHDTPSNNLPDYSQVTHQNLWKYKCEIRNVAAIEAVASGKSKKIRALRQVLKNSKKAYRATRDFKIFKALLLSGIRGAFWDYKKHIEHV
ncbi:glycosyltransferase family 2 protein [Pseudochrobactrum kiredjianiae]|uniref:Glycosyltransferase family 2 protein n=1 Tax=Pseudochrobactrum kiredjianiae TaxID=386305 RepID=A0ABW3V181_9HYPH|nr:glycosyltransferase family 2 protein [Pseudochrobactrum kiredjianiae]MDM7851885.1 glycosyltransferase family 2 protein [Pseudochrobactrum kiredjianiae]